MKRKLRLLFHAMMLFVSFANAQKIDVWDFGGETLDVNLYNNKLTATDINTWYTYSSTIVSGTSASANTLTSSVEQTLTSGVLKLKTGNNDRLYTSNTSVTRYGNALSNSEGYTGRYYCNGNASATTRFFTLTLNENDEVTIIARADAAADLTIVNTTTNTQTEIFPLTTSTTTATIAKFVAKEAGDFKITSLNGKGSYYRILRKAAVYKTITGSLDVSQAQDIPSGYSVVFTNTAGKSWTSSVVAGAYSVNLPSGYTYQVSLKDANGYIISSGSSLTVSDATTTHDIVVLKVSLFTASGIITGLGTNLSKLTLVYTPSVTGKVYVPKPIINTTTGAYTVELEANTPYVVSGSGVNDFEILANTINISAATTTDVAFTSKPVYPITVTATGLNAAQESKLKLIFSNMNEAGYVYNFDFGSAISLRNGTYAVAYTGLTGEPVELKLISNLTVNNAAASKVLAFKTLEDTSALPYTAELTVGPGKQYQTINESLKVIRRMTRSANERVTIVIEPGNYEEMLVIDKPNITIKNASSSPSIALKNAGVGIDANAVRITSYYGLGYNYFSQGTDNKWNADALAVNKANGYTSYTNVSGTTNGSYWNATVVVSANGFIAENLIIENSFNQYVSKKESEDVLVLVTGNKGVRSTTEGSTAVQAKSFVERAAAIGIANSIDKTILNNCRVVGRQDSFFGGTNARVAIYKGVMMGGTDYLFGPMNAVFYKSDLAMNTSEDNNDVSYITAAQQTAGRGYLMYECKITSATPGIETASVYRSKPGYFGRPWQANTSEVVFFNTTIEKSDNPAFNEQSLISPIGWNSSLGGESKKMYEYGTVELSGANNQSSRAGWATTMTTVVAKTTAVPSLSDGTEITPLNFTKGTDNWDPFADLISADLSTKNYSPTTSVQVYSIKNKIIIENVKETTAVKIYSITGALVKKITVEENSDFEFKKGIWIAVVEAVDGKKSVKLITY